MNKEYYHDSGISIILNITSQEKIRKELTELTCNQCGSFLVLYVAVDASCICCGDDIYNNHNTGYSIDMDDYSHEQEPKIIKKEK
jgi:hypothetical protein